MSRSAETQDPTDALIATLRDHPARLDDLGRARIAAVLGALPPPRPEATAPARASSRAAWRWGLVAACAAAAAAGVWALAGRGDLPSAKPAPVAAPSTNRAGSEAAQRVLHLGSITATLHADTVAEVVTATAGGELVLRWGSLAIDAPSDEPVVLRAAEYLVTASRAAFAASVDDQRLRLHVTRGEVLLRRTGELRTTTLAAPRAHEIALAAALAPRDRAARPATLERGAAEPAATRAADAAPPQEPARDVPHDTLAPQAPPAPASAADDAQLEALYRGAEDALAGGDLAAGRSALEQLVARAPRDRRADAARFDLARLAERAGDFANAKRWLGEVLSNGRDPVVREPAHRALCRVLVRERAAAATECLLQLRREHPSSAADAETLGELAARVHAERGCAAALPLHAEYLRLYPSGAAAPRARAAQLECQPPAP